MSARRGGTICSIGIPTICWKTFPTKTTKMLSTRNSSILMMSSSEYLCLESECFFTKYDSSGPKTRYLYLRLPFLNMEEFRMILAVISRCPLNKDGRYDRLTVLIDIFRTTLRISVCTLHRAICIPLSSLWSQLCSWPAIPLHRSSWSMWIPYRLRTPTCPRLSPLVSKLRHSVRHLHVVTERYVTCTYNEQKKKKKETTS